MASKYRSKKSGEKKVVEEDNWKVIQMACLGRPFRMGMLYDCRKDTLIPGVTLWSDQKLKSALDSTPQIGSNFEVVVDDSLQSKALHLDVSGSLKLSFIGGLVDVSGSARYLYDRQSSKQKSRVSLKYWSTTKFEQLTMDQLATEHIEYPEVFTKKTATHVVTGILYGADAIFVFDRKVEEGEKTHDVHGKIEAMVKALPGKMDIGGEAGLDITVVNKKEAQKLECKFYGDLRLKKNPTTFSDAMTVYQQLPDLLNGDNGPVDVPKKVWLYPLSKLNSAAAKLVHEISVSFVHQAQTVMEELLDLNVRSNELIKTRACSHFSGIKEQLTMFKDRVSEYKTTFSKELKQILPFIREGQPEMKLADLFRSKECSPFNSESLIKWLDWKEQEIKVLGAYLKSLQHLEFAIKPGDLQEILLDDPDIVLCFSFEIASSVNGYLDKMLTYLHSQDHGQTSTDSTYPPWFENEQAVATMGQKVKLFATFAKTNKENGEVKFVVAQKSKEGAESSCVIVLYEKAIKKEFDPPSAPDNVRASHGDIIPCTINLEWSKPEYGSENVNSYTVSYQKENDPNQSWDTIKTMGNDTSITVYNLQENQGYYFRVRAECKVGISQYSKISDLILTKKGHTLSWNTVKDEIYKDAFPWDMFARHLGMPQHKINLISKGKPWETEVNLKQVINWWLRQSDASWSQLGETLQKMGLKKLATKVRQNHPEVNM